MFRHCSVSHLSNSHIGIIDSFFRRPRVQDSVQLSRSLFLQCPNPCRLFSSVLCLRFLFCSIGHGFWSRGNYSAAAVENSQHRLGNFRTVLNREIAKHASLDSFTNSPVNVLSRFNSISVVQLRCGSDGKNGAHIQNTNSVLGTSPLKQ